MQVRESEPRAMLYDALALRCPRLPHARTIAPLFSSDTHYPPPYVKGTTTIHYLRKFSNDSHTSISISIRTANRIHPIIVKNRFRPGRNFV